MPETQPKGTNEPVDEASTGDACQDAPNALPSAIRHTYETLSPAARLVAQAYGVAAPMVLAFTRLHEIVGKASTAVLGRRMTTTQTKKANQELLDADVVKRRPGEGVWARPSWVLPLTRIAHREGNLAALLRACEQIHRHMWYDTAEDRMLFRCHIVAGNYKALDEFVEDNGSENVGWSMLADPAAEDLLRALPERHLPHALAGCLGHIIDAAAPSEPVVRICQELSPTPANHLADIAFIRVLQGRFDAALAVFENLPPSVGDAKPARVGRSATHALVALLRGNDTHAWQFINQTIAEEKADSRKRNVFPTVHAFTLALLALVRIESPESMHQLNQLQRVAGRVAPDHLVDALNLVANAARVKAKAGVFGRTPEYPDLNTLFDGLTSCWLNDFHPNPEVRHELLLRYRHKAHANGYAWVVAECDEVLRLYAAWHGDQASTNGDPNSLGGHQDVSVPADSGAHAKLGTVTLVDLAVPVPDWEYSLKTLEQLAYATANKSKRTRKAATPAKRRLAWELRHEDDFIRIAAKEQRQTKNGAWSKGRKITLRRLAQEAAKLDYLLPQDLDAIAALSSHRSWDGGHEIYAGLKSLYALAGHPHVIDHSGEPVEVVRRVPELSIDEMEKGGVSVRIEPHSGEFDDDYGFTAVTDRRYEVAHFTPEHKQLFTVIPEGGLTLPAGAKRRLLTAVSSLASAVRVQSDTDDEAGDATPVAADPEPWVRLEPLDAGLAVALVVEPIPDSDRCFEPGTGGAVVFASLDGQSVRTRRDLVAEKEAVTRLTRQCPELGSRPTERQPLNLPDPAQCLELLASLDHAGARCKWPKGQPFRIVAHATTPSLSLTVKSGEQWLEASGKLAVDEQRVMDLKRLFALLEANPDSRFLQLDDGEFVALTQSFRRKLDDFRSLAQAGAEGAMRLNPLQALALDDLLEEAEVDADQGVRDLKARLQAAQDFDPVVPSTLQAQLRPYQVAGYRWLARLAHWGAGACLADDMGLGKTVQALAVLLERAPTGPALVVAPTSVVANWVDEARRFAPTLTPKTYTGAAQARAAILAEPAPFDLYITTYGVLQNDIERLVDVTWACAVLDEAQAIKNPLAKRSRASRRLRANFRIVTTGTPVQNNLMDLHSLFSFINPGLLGSQQQFRRNFAVPIERDDDFETQGRLRRLIAPFVLRRLKSEVLDDLPERTEVTLHVAMSTEEATLYEALRQHAVAELEAARAAPDTGEGARRVRILAHLTRLRLACCNPRLVLEDGAAPKSSKLATFAATLEELLANRHKVLVFSQFVVHLRLVEEYLREAGVSYQYLDGSTPAKKRTERITAFQSGQGDVFLISVKAGGTGLNLTAADYVIHMDPWWNPAVEDQASDRAHRIGQTRPVTIYRLVTEGTIEERIVDLHGRKRGLAQQLLEGTDSAARLNADELLDLLRQPLLG